MRLITKACDDWKIDRGSQSWVAEAKVLGSVAGRARLELGAEVEVGSSRSWVKSESTIGRLIAEVKVGSVAQVGVIFGQGKIDCAERVGIRWRSQSWVKSESGQVRIKSRIFNQ